MCNLGENGELTIHMYDLRKHGLFKGSCTQKIPSTFCFLPTNPYHQVFQRREDGSVDFFRYWSDYENGFGNITSEHWLGNEKINRISVQGHYELRVDLADLDGNERYARYDNFRLGNACTKYTLILGIYNGDAGKLYRTNMLR